MQLRIRQLLRVAIVRVLGVLRDWIVVDVDDFRLGWSLLMLLLLLLPLLLLPWPSGAERPSSFAELRGVCWTDSAREVLVHRCRGLRGRLLLLLQLQLLLLQR